MEHCNTIRQRSPGSTKSETRDWNLLLRLAEDKEHCYDEYCGEILDIAHCNSLKGPLALRFN